VPNPIDLTGHVYGRLTVLELDRNNSGAYRKWICICVCGNTVSVSGNSMRRGLTTSCGCFRIEQSTDYATKHGRYYTDEYKIWIGIKRRCKFHPRYAGKGITISELWANDFLAFLSHVGKRPSKEHSIDRIDGKLGYHPNNVRWATPVEQARNTASNVLVCVDGNMMTLTEACQIKGADYELVRKRIKRGVPIDEAFRKTGETVREPRQ